MLVEPERQKRHRLFEYVAKPLDSFVEPGHVLRRIDEAIDFRKLAVPLQAAYDPDQGRPAVPPEVLLRALTLGYVYRIHSFRRLCTVIRENLAFRWFLFMGLEDEVFDHSTLSVFLSRVGPEGFRALLVGLSHELSKAGLLSSEAFADSSLVAAAVSTASLHPSGRPVEEFAAKATEENGLWRITQVVKTVRGRRRVLRLARRYYQDPKGKLELHPRDLDARWRKVGKSPVRLTYKQHVIADSNGFILAQDVTHSTTGDADPVPKLLAEAPVPMRLFTADTGYTSGALRRHLEHQGVEAHIPLHTRHLQHRKSRQGFYLRNPEALICPAGKVLRRVTYYEKDETWTHAAATRDCQQCCRKDLCLPPLKKRRVIQLSKYEPEFLRAESRNRTRRHRRLRKRRQAVIEGVFAHLKDLGFRRARRFGLPAVRCEGYLVAFAHNVLKAIGRRIGPAGASLTRSSYSLQPA